MADNKDEDLKFVVSFKLKNGKISSDLDFGGLLNYAKDATKNPLELTVMLQHVANELMGDGRSLLNTATKVLEGMSDSIIAVEESKPAEAIMEFLDMIKKKLSD